MLSGVSLVWLGFAYILNILLLLRLDLYLNAFLLFQRLYL